MKHRSNTEYRINRSGISCPVGNLWDNGSDGDAQKALHSCIASHTKVEGIRYIIDIGRAENYLYRNGQRWYVDHSP